MPNTVKYKRIFIALLSPCLLGCSSNTISKEEQAVLAKDAVVAPKPQSEKWQTYVIKKGNHYAGNGFKMRLFKGDSLHLKLAFDESIKARTQIPNNQKDWNKIIGFSDCGSTHQQNSARLVWRYIFPYEAVEIGQYLYIDGERNFASLGDVKIGDTATAAIYRNATQYGFMLNDTISYVPRPCNSSPMSYWLFPYFGGDETAPQKVKIHLLQTYP